MGNLSSSLFGTSAEKEWKKLTKKNTKANRDVVTEEGDPGVAAAAATQSGLIAQKTFSGSRIGFVNMVTEVTYDHEAGHMEVAHESLHREEGMSEEEMNMRARQVPSHVLHQQHASARQPSSPSRTGSILRKASSASPANPVHRSPTGIVRQNGVANHV